MLRAASFGVGAMVRCASCGLEIKEPIKTWTVTLGKVKRTKITYGTFQCDKCRRKFKATIKKEETSPEPRQTSAFPPPYVTMIV
ncbi:hypothetical protein [Candidatus Hecatella orcuttiae]|uniref:hypothetical protein n=1 Tax=Candidatus Hecatella orcuttiae TaxID=1935119 RepID=UPI002867ECEF|nr:hypothetical protein [Candidatus Hecatella orcuttiae]